MASNSTLNVPSFSFLLLLFLAATLLSGIIPTTSSKELPIREATVLDLQLAFKIAWDTNLKENIATKDKLNNTADSFALHGSVVPRDSGFAKRLRKSGAVILGKASLSEWCYSRTLNAPNGWNARVGQGKTDGSILCPSEVNSVVGIKPTVGLTCRAGVVPISPRQDTVGPIRRTLIDAAYVLEAVAGIDARDKETIEVSQYIPRGGYSQYLKIDGLRGKRLGLLGAAVEFFLGNDTFRKETFKKHLRTLV
ncbi:hypothetical protein L6164_012068 [Bauhinia variegata]|nr:hypothetical protein L6164_012068 [Bauhinia variegata]